jgi:hypothetical protein
MIAAPASWRSVAAALSLVCSSAHARPEEGAAAGVPDRLRIPAPDSSHAPARPAPHEAARPDSPALAPGARPPTDASRPAVSLTLADPSPVIGLLGETLLTIDVEKPPASPMPVPRMFCSVGQIEDVSRQGPARFTARYLLPAARFPQPAILVAEFPDPRGPLRGMVAVALRAAATPSFRTDPGAQVTLRVGDRDFGPQVAPADGLVHVPVVVAPGVGFAVARSVNQHGKSTEQVVDLRVPYSQRLLIAAPETLAAGAVGEVAVYAVEPSGRPANAAMLVLRAGSSRVHPLGGGMAGEARFLVRAPTVLRRKSMRIEAQLKEQNTTRIATRIPLVPGPAAGLVLEPEAPRLDRKSSPSLRVFLGAEDAFGNPVDAGRAGVLVDGTPTTVEASADGAPMVTVQAPAPASRRAEVVVEGVLDMGHAFARIPIGAHVRPVGPKAPDVIAYPRWAVTPRLGVLTNFGPLVGATFFVDGSVYPSVRDPGLALGLALGFVESRFAAESAGGISRTQLSTFPVSFQIRQHWARGRAFAGLGAGAGFAVSVARVKSYGATTVGSGLGGVVEVSVEGGFLLRKAHLVLGLRYLALHLSDFSSGDRVAGNAGGAMADLGYRLVF